MREEDWMELPGIALLVRDGLMKVCKRTAVFQLASFDLTRPAGEGDRLREVICWLRLLKDAMVDGLSEGAEGWKPKVGVSGSAALCLVERLMSQDWNGRWRGRWKRKARGNGANLIWNANDLDIFVAGRPGSRRASFRRVVESTCANLAKRLAKGKHGLIVEDEYEQRYSSRPAPFLIRNARMDGIETSISFVQVPGCEDLEEVTEDFDMDIVRCMCNIEKQELYLPVHLVSRIWEGKARVVDFETRHTYPLEAEERMVTATLKRMRKYGERGYRFSRYCIIRSEEESHCRKRIKMR
jgi:hypothetical protein